jgi:hypothetical protein
VAFCAGHSPPAIYEGYTESEQYPKKPMMRIADPHHRTDHQQFEIKSGFTQMKRFFATLKSLNSG